MNELCFFRTARSRASPNERSVTAGWGGNRSVRTNKRLGQKEARQSHSQNRNGPSIKRNLPLSRQSSMTRIASTSFVALICITALLFRSSAAFTISLAPLLTSWGHTSKIANRVTGGEMDSKNRVTEKAPSSFQFTQNDVRLISDCKSNTIEYIFAKSLDRGFD